MKKTLAAAAILGTIGLPSALAEDLTSMKVGAALTDASKSLSYHVKFRAEECSKGNMFVCTIYADVPHHRSVYKFLAVFPDPTAALNHFDFVLTTSTESSTYGIASLAVAETLLAGSNVTIEDASAQITEVMQQAGDSGAPVSTTYRGVSQGVSLIPGAGALIQIQIQRQ